MVIVDVCSLMQTGKGPLPGLFAVHYTTLAYGKKDTLRPNLVGRQYTLKMASLLCYLEFLMEMLCIHEQIFIMELDVQRGCHYIIWLMFC